MPSLPITDADLESLPEKLRGPVARWHELVEQSPEYVEAFTTRLLTDQRYEALLDRVAGHEATMVIEGSGQPDPDGVDWRKVRDAAKAEIEATAHTAAADVLEDVLVDLHLAKVLEP